MLYRFINSEYFVDVIKKNYKKEMFIKLFDACQSVKDKFGKKMDIDDLSLTRTTLSGIKFRAVEGSICYGSSGLSAQARNVTTFVNKW